MDDLQDLGTEWRRQRGNGVLAQVALDVIRDRGGGRWAACGIKNPEEIGVLREAGGFFLVAIEASAGTRWDRVKKDYGGDRTEFHRNDERDEREIDGITYSWRPHGQNVRQCVRRADYVVWNDEPLQARPGEPGQGMIPSLDQDGTVKSLGEKPARLVGMVDGPGPFQATDVEVRMSQAHTIARQSDCLQRKVGAVLVNARGYTIAEGCNRAPEGAHGRKDKLKECYRARERRKWAQGIPKTVKCGHCGGALSPGLVRLDASCGKPVPRDLRRFRDLELCRAIHAEEGTLLQACRFGGQGVEGGTIDTTTFPCALCAKKIIETKLASVIYLEPYPGKEAFGLLKGHNVDLRHFEGVSQKAFPLLFRLEPREEDDDP